MKGFRWCPHCSSPHALSDRHCRLTGKPFEPNAKSSGKMKAAPRVTVPTPRAVESPVTGLTLDNKYRLIKKIGAGGMGAVYEAESIGFGRRVAVKISKSEADARLQREGEVVAALHHPNICSAYDSGKTPWGSAYVVLERLYGETLGQRLQRGPITDDDLVEIVVQILSGLHAAHRAGIVHRDVKPENVFLVEREGLAPLVKILDFGFARDLSGRREQTKLTKTGWICGTLDYMAPEQMMGSAVDPRADIFSVGVILFVGLTRRPPFGTDVKKNVIHSRALRLKRVRRDLPPEMDEVLRRALENHPTRRYASALEFQRALVQAFAKRDAPDACETLQRPAFDALPRLQESSSTAAPESNTTDAHARSPHDSQTIPNLHSPSSSNELSPI